MTKWERNKKERDQENSSLQNHTLILNLGRTVPQVIYNNYNKYKIIFIIIIIIVKYNHVPKTYCDL